MAEYVIAEDGYGWLHDKVKQPLGECGVCETTLVPHVFGAPLKVCPECFPQEAAQ